MTGFVRRLVNESTTDAAENRVQRPSMYLTDGYYHMIDAMCGRPRRYSPLMLDS
jgi:hypothetical protein